MKFFGREFKFNNNKVYHAGDKPTPSEIGAAASSHTHNYAGSSSAGGAANSANKLATARTINGTSFNGSANITTANWGTARTITIGSTGKSVNGSGNVSWTLSEIGAAAASHTHSYLPLSGGTLTGRLTATGKISMPTTGASWISGMTLTNAPLAITTQQSTSSYHPVLAVKTSGNHVANIGGLGDNFGFYGFKSGRTENATDWSFVFNASSGAVTSTAAITAPTFNGSLNGNAKTATSAATLTTARTINGTSFNGSANITTANWGTARNITIGNTTKSVNGSGNVSWSLSEIGAAGSKHNHGLLHDSFGITVADTTTDNGWSMLNGTYDGYLLKSIRSNANAPAWLLNNYSAGIVFGGSDTHGVVSVSYDYPTVRFAGGNGSKPVWHFTVKGSTGATYDMNNLTSVYLRNLGARNPQTGRTQGFGNVYSYNTNASASSGAPTTYTSVIGFGQGTSGTVEIAGNWNGQSGGMFYRALRDTTDNWYSWTRLVDESQIRLNGKKITVNSSAPSAATGDIWIQI